jgi:Fe-S cluster assembly protein SufD
VSSTLASTLASYAEQFRAGAPEEPAWLAARRAGAMDRFAVTGFPAARDEEWRFTPIGPIANGTFVTPAPAELFPERIAPYLFGHDEWTRLVFVDGRFAPELSSAESLPGGLTVATLPDALGRAPAALEAHLARHAPIDGSPFTALNTALFADGAFVEVRRGTELAEPVHVLHVITGETPDAAAHPRLLVLVGAGARAAIVESYIGLGESRSFTNAVTEVVVGENAWVEHARLQREAEAAYHIGLTQVSQARDSHYRSFVLQMGGAIARHNLTCRLDAPNVETLMYGLYLAHGEQLVDNHTAIHHDHPGCRSWEVYKGVLDDRAHAVFNGKVFVTPEAQQTDAKQTNRNLLLSAEAKVDTKPQLEIFADDVKCTHGATVGFLDKLALFYARSRGVPATEAQKLLTYAFAAEVVDEVAIAPVREELNRLVLERVGHLG